MMMKAILCVLMGLGFAPAAITAEAPGATQKQLEIDIAPQALTDALNEWAQQTRLQLIYPAAETTRRLVAPAIKGAFTPRAALSLLLAGTALTFEFVNERTVAIRERAQPGTYSGGASENAMAPGDPPVSDPLARGQP